MLEVRDLHVSVEGKPVLKGLSLSVKAGEVHAIMGPNGSGKSTLSKVIAGHPDYEVTSGEILFEINSKLVNLLELEVDVRAKEGIFLGFQYPVEVPGVTNRTFLQMAFNAICRHQGVAAMSDAEFDRFVRARAQWVDLDPQFLDRFVNSGFSGGEKKRNEILQMAVLAPRLSFLDETDSGLDIDALRIVSQGVLRLKSPRSAIVLVTHYQRFLEYVSPDFVHVLAGGEIVKTGGPELAVELERSGYDWLTQPPAGAAAAHLLPQERSQP